MTAQTITSWLPIPTIESGIALEDSEVFQSFDCTFNVYLTLAMLDALALAFLNRLFPCETTTTTTTTNLNIRN